MFYDAARRDHGLAQDPLKSLIVPRPIGWISTIDGQEILRCVPSDGLPARNSSRSLLLRMVSPDW